MPQTSWKKGHKLGFEGNDSVILTDYDHCNINCLYDM